MDQIKVDEAARAWKEGEAAAAHDVQIGNRFRGAHGAANECGYEQEGVARRCFTGGYFQVASKAVVMLDTAGRCRA